MCLDCKKMEKEKNRYYERTRIEIVKLKYKHFDHVQLEKIALVEEYDRKLIRKIRDIQEWSFYETKESACFDLRSTKDYILQPHQPGHVYSKSDMAFKYGVAVLNSPGIIDADYKDEIKVLLMNHSKEDYINKRGDAVAQMGFVKTFKAVKNVIEIEGCFCREVKMSMIKDVERKGGFGSTGK
ncbi:deoxyuridine 5'-triphosphate nucleotidohydrolase-like [Hydra vulgaris]|uniref:Deoxyuridine 5'-triphosphate nucleotidohydrolase n=1 Tax=Hydra vulgaris TaxID=6087 RepID=A0ABM4BME9_HYDVU